MSITRVLRKSGQFSLNVRPITRTRAPSTWMRRLIKRLDELRGHIGAHAVIETTAGEDDFRMVADRHALCVR